MKKTIHAQSGHTLFIKDVKFVELPENVKKFDHMDKKYKIYVVKNWDKNGVVFMYITKRGKLYNVWYRGGGFWASYGRTIEEAINGAQTDGWLHA